MRYVTFHCRWLGSKFQDLWHRKWRLRKRTAESAWSGGYADFEGERERDRYRHRGRGRREEGTRKQEQGDEKLELFLVKNSKGFHTSPFSRSSSSEWLISW